MAKKRGPYEVSEEEFDELVSNNRENIVYLEYDEHTSKISEDGVELSYTEESWLGREFIDSLIDSKKEIAWGRDDKRDVNYEFTRWNSKKD